MGKHRWRVAPVLMVMALAAAACGARVDDAQVHALAPGQQARGASATGGPAQGDAASADVTGPGASGASAVAGPAASAGSSTTVAPAGGNGGATDIGVTADTITLGNVSTLSGPVPGLFAGAVYGTQAAIAYQNSLGGVFGRKLKLVVGDDQFDTGQNRAQTTDLAGRVLGFVGGFSLYDDAGADLLQKNGVPDVQVPLSTGLQDSPVNFSVAPVRDGSPTGPWNWLKGRHPEAMKIGAIYSDVPAAKKAFLDAQQAAQVAGYQFVYSRGIQATETDFTADVVRMRSAGVNLVFNMADVKTDARLANNMAQQGLKALYVTFGPAYDPAFLQLAGANAEGVLNITTQAMFLGEDAPYIPEIKTALAWLQKIKPGYHPDLYAAYGWGSARLFIKALQDAGPKATRASVLAALRKIDSWNGFGMFPDVGPASKRPATCFIMITVHNGKFERADPPPPAFICKDSVFQLRH